MAPQQPFQPRPEVELDELYRDVILDHYRHPRHRGTIAEASISEEGYNPLCGDEVSLYLKIDGDTIKGVSFQGAGCSISQASASMLTEAVQDKSLAEAEEIFHRFQEMMAGPEGGEAEPEDGELGDLVALHGVRKFPVRVKCATLAWHTLKEAIERYRKGS